MDSLIFLLGIFISTIIILIVLTQKSQKKMSKLPPGKTGWPFLGETLTCILCPQKFMLDRMKKYSPDVFQTSLAGERTAVFCGPLANKFLSSNEGKLVTYWLPRSVATSLSYQKIESSSPSGKPTHELSYKFLKVESVQHYVSMVHSMTRQHLDKCWSPFLQVKAFTLAREFTFALTCQILVNCSDDQVRELAEPFFLLVQGILSVPVYFPGTAYYKAVNGGKLVKERLVKIIKQRKSEIIMEEKQEYDKSKCQDLLGQLLVDSDKNGKFLSEEEIASKIIGLMFAGFYPTSTTIAFVLNNLAQHPDVYQKVLREQLGIAKFKEPGEALSWIDVQKMKYSWNVICETMRLAPPVPGNFREVIVDFTYAGFQIPKGWKIHWSPYTTHMNPDYFPDPETFDPSRFEGDGPAPYTFVPFGAGPRMCAGKEFARIQMLVFMHNAVTRFKFKQVNPKEKIIYNPDPIPSEGLPIYLQPHTC